MLAINGYSQGTWLQKANYGGGTTYRAVGCSIGNKGYAGTGVYNSDFWEWDQSTNVWTQKADFGGGGRDWATCFAIGNKVYVGTGGLPDFNDLWEWDQSTNVWAQKASLGAVDSNGIGVLGRVGAVGFSINGKGYIGTGNNGASFFKDFWEYDPLTDSWTQKANFGGVGRFGAVGFSIGNKGYIGTGSDGNGHVLKDFWEYDPVSDTWTQMADFGGVGRYSATSFVIGTKVYLGTGLILNSPYCVGDFWSWDQNTNLWTPSADFPGGMRSRAIGFSIGDVGYIGTGTDSNNTDAGDFWEYSPACGVAAPHICMVTTDSATNYNFNIVYWDKNLYSNVDSFLVYRKDPTSANYFHIGSISKNSLSLFVDTAFSIGGPNGGNPQYSTWFYKLAILDTCGNTSAMSPYHQTMFVQQNGSNFTWNAYSVETGQANPVSGYSFLRDDNNTGNWHVLVNPSGTSTTDPNFASFPNGNWRIDALGFNCSSSLKANTASHSNTANPYTVNIHQISNFNSGIIFYPNPATDFLTVTNIEHKTKIYFYNLLGELIMEKETEKDSKLDLSHLKQGIYTLITEDHSGKTVNRVTITK